MRQAITTTYKGPTNFKGSRIIVRADAGRMIVHWDHALDVEENHRRAAEVFARAKGWIGAEPHNTDWRLVGGGLPGNAGYCFVLVEAGLSLTGGGK